METMKENQKTLLSYSFDLLARRPYSTAEMHKKLHTKNEKLLTPASHDDIQDIIESLLKSKFLNDENYTDLFIESSLRNRPEGKRRIMERLRQKGVDAELIRRKLNLCGLDESEMAAELAAKKVRTLQKYADDQAALNQRLSRFLISRGFTADTVFKVVKQKLYKEHLAV